MNLKIYLIIGCIILISIFVIILLLIKHKHNSTPNSTPNPKYIPINNNTNKKGIHKCFNRYDDMFSNEDLSKLLCDNEDTCKGYYISPDKTVFQTFNECDTSHCGSGNPQMWPTKKTKVDNYTTPHDNPRGACCVKPLYFTKNGLDSEDTIQKMCDEFPACKGYYKHINKPYYIASSSEIVNGDIDDNIDDCHEISDDDIYNGEFPIFMKKNT